jgi:hypothetical protein
MIDRPQASDRNVSVREEAVAEKHAAWGFLIGRMQARDTNHLSHDEAFTHLARDRDRRRVERSSRASCQTRDRI